MKKTAANPYTFTLILAGPLGLTEESCDAFFEAGCDDALAGERDGVVFLDFIREAPSSREAILSAIADVESAGLGTRVVRVEPDEFVTMSEIARRSRRSRENIRQLAMGRRGPGGFPPPVANLTRKSPIWRWTDVVEWFSAREREKDITFGKGPAGESGQADLGPTVAAINAALELRRHARTVGGATKLFKMLEPKRRNGYSDDR